MVAQVVALVRLHLIANVQTIDLFEVLAIALAKRSKFIVNLALLRLKARICVLTHLHFVLHALDVDVTLTDELPLTVELAVELGVLTFAIIVDSPLLVNLRSERLYETNVGIDTRFVVFVHPALILI